MYLDSSAAVISYIGSFYLRRRIAFPTRESISSTKTNHGTDQDCICDSLPVALSKESDQKAQKKAERRTAPDRRPFLSAGRVPVRPTLDACCPVLARQFIHFFYESQSGCFVSDRICY